MTHAERVALIRPGADGSTGAWADLGAGSGAFTLALAVVLGGSSRIYAVDSDAGSLRALAGDAVGLSPRIEVVHADFTGELSLPPLDGILLANSLHFQPDAAGVLAHAARWLTPGGRLIIVEYDIAAANPWVPYPLPWARLPAVAARAGFVEGRLLGTRPSGYHQRMYAAAFDAPAPEPRRMHTDE